MSAQESALSFEGDAGPSPVLRWTNDARKIPDDAVWRAIHLIDTSGIPEQVDLWKQHDRQGHGGRPETFPTRALLVAMMLCAMTERPMLVARFTDVLFRLISPTMRHALGVPTPPPANDFKAYDATYRNVRTRFHGLLALMDPSPTPKNRRLTPDLFILATEIRRSAHSAEEWTTFDERLEWFVNRLLETSVRILPREVRRAWKGSVAVDATVVPAFARHEKIKPRQGKGARREVLVHSADPDAAWYARSDGEGNDAKDGAHKKPVWGYEATLVVAGSDDPGDHQAIPSLVVGMAPLHKPGHDVGQNAMRALRSVHARAHPAHWLAADRAYTNAKPGDFQLPARSLGYRPVLDYKIDQLGIQDSFAGMLLIDGAWYCPSIPKVLVSATSDFRNQLIDEPTYRARLAERWRHQVLPKASADAEGHVRLRCPAANPWPQARCELKPRSEGLSTRGKLRIQVAADVATHPPTICTQQSVTLPPEAGAKFAQDLLHGSDRWHSVYSTLRNSVEGMNGFVKDGAHEALDDPERRRVRGVAAQSVFVAFLLCAANLRKIEAFMVAADAEAAGFERRRPRRRRTTSIGHWSPGIPSVGVGSDPDPPLIA